MKFKNTLALLCLTPLFSFAQYGELSNGGFEDWSMNILFEQPADWVTFIDYGVANIAKSSDAYSGNYSAHIFNSITSAMDSVSGNLILGNSTGNGFTGLPYTSDFDALNGYWKYETSASDTMVAIVIKWHNGNDTMVTHKINGQQTGWAPFSLPIPAGACDSVFIGFSTTNPFVANFAFDINSYLKLDSIHLTHSSGPAPAGLPNADFENWTSVGVEDPDNWHTANAFMYSIGIAGTVKSTNAYSGNYAVKIHTSANQFGDTISGFLSLGILSPYGGSFYNPAPYDAMPALFSGYYMAENSNDNSFIMLEFYKNGVQVGFNHIPLVDTNVYTYFSAPISLSQQPDSVSIFSVSGNDYGSAIYFDDLNFSGGNVALQELMAQLGLKVFPNPAKEFLYIESDKTVENGELQVLDLSGRVISTQNIYITAGDKFQLNVSELTSGVYIYQIRVGQEWVRKQFIVTGK